MRFYAESISSELLFSEKDIIKAILTAWNYNADLWLVDDKTKYSDLKKFATLEKELLFSSNSPFACNLQKYKVEIVENTDLHPWWDIAVRCLESEVDYCLGDLEIKKLKDKIK